MYCPLFRFCFFMPVNTHKQTQKGSNQESMQSGNSNDQTWKCWVPGSAQNVFGLWGPEPKKDQGSGLRAPPQKFQGSKAPGTPPPPLGPWLFLLWKFGGKNFCDLPKDTNFKFAVQQAIDTIIFFKNKPRTFEKQHCEKGQDLAHISHQFGSNIKCDIENIELSPRKIVMLQSVYCWLEMWKNVWQVFLTLLSFM